MAQGKKQQAAKTGKKAPAAKPKKAASKAKPAAAAAKAGRSASAAKAKKPAAKPKVAAKAKKPAVKPKAAAKAKKPVARTGAAKKAASKAKPKKAAAKVSRLPHLDEKTLKQIIAKLTEMRDESSRFVNTQVQADLLQREEGGDVGDDMDQASNERDREFSLLLHQRHLRRLKQIQDAFNRMEDGSYGLCEGTEEPINPKRLLIMPLARFSLEYQQQQEKMLGRSPEESPGAEETMISDD